MRICPEPGATTLLSRVRLRGAVLGSRPRPRFEVEGSLAGLFTVGAPFITNLVVPYSYCSSNIIQLKHVSNDLGDYD